MFLMSIFMQTKDKENSPIDEPARRRQRRSCTYTVFLKIAPTPELPQRCNFIVSYECKKELPFLIGSLNMFLVLKFIILAVA